MVKATRTIRRNAFARRGRAQKGVSLLEVLLVVGLMTVLITGAAQIFDDWFQKSVNRTVAVQMRDLQTAAEQYVRLNLEDVRDTMVPNPNDTAELDLADLIDRDFLPDGYIPRNAFGQALRVLVRNAGNDTVEGTAIEVVTVADDWNGIDSRMRDLRLFDAALAGGPRLGLISAADLGASCCNGNIQSAYGEWSLPLSAFSGLYTRTPDVAIGGYMAAYGRVAREESVNENYLYRVEVPGAPHLNRMMTNMDMNNNDIVNAGTIVADHAQVSGSAVFQGRETGGFSSPYVIAVQNGYTGEGSLAIGANGDSKGDLIVTGDDDPSTHDFVVQNAMALPGFSGQAITGTANVNNVQTMGSGSFDVMNVRGGQFEAGSIVAVNTLVDGNIQQTTFLQTSSADVNSVTAANAVTAITNVSGSAMTVNNTLDANNNIAVQGNLSAGQARGTETVTIRNLIGCGNGCPP